MTYPGRARAVGCEHGLHVVAGGGAHELAAPLGQNPGDTFGIVAPQRLAGQNHDAGVDVVGVDPRRCIGVVDDCAERPVVDPVLVGIGRELYRRLIERLARDHEVPAGELLAQAAQMDP